MATANEMIERLDRDAALYRVFAGRFPSDGRRADNYERDARMIETRQANPTIYYEVGVTVRRVGAPANTGETGKITEIVQRPGQGPPLYRVEWNDGYSFAHEWTYIVPIAGPMDESNVADRV